MNLSASFIEYTRSLLGDEEYEKLVSALSAEPPVSIRLNQAKIANKKDGLKALSDRVAWSSEGYYLNGRLTFTFDPLFHAGCYYVQEASSMFVEQVLRQYVAERVVMLDLCAAPGGKSTHARAVLPEGSLLVANEVIRNRSQILAENLTKWGHPDVVVTNNDPSDFSSITSFFDVILTDVPCSGEGMFRKDPGAIEEWSPENVEVCWQRQRRIIKDIWPCLKPGGILIYSTCTYNTKEDEENILWIKEELGAELLPLDIPKEWNITGDLFDQNDYPVYRFLPHRTKGEGFFLAALRKPEFENEDRNGSFNSSSNVGFNFGSNSSFSSKKKNKKGGNSASLVSKENIAQAKGWLQQSDEYDVYAEETSLMAFAQQYAGELSVLKQSLRIVQAGLKIGEVKGKDLLPDHALAMNRLLKQDAFPMREIGYEQAIAFLRKEAIVLSPDTPRGYVLLTYENIPLGFVKNIGNRANNLYPQEWRIRSGYLPDEVLTLSGKRE